LGSRTSARRDSRLDSGPGTAAGCGAVPIAASSGDQDQNGAQQWQEDNR